MNSRLISIIRKEFIQIFRDPRTLGLILVMPIVQFFPLQSIWNLIHIPFPRYAFQEIQDFLTFKEVAIVVVWIGIFNYISYWKLKRSDI